MPSNRFRARLHRQKCVLPAPENTYHADNDMFTKLNTHLGVCTLAIVASALGVMYFLGAMIAAVALLIAISVTIISIEIHLKKLSPV